MNEHNSLPPTADSNQRWDQIADFWDQHTHSGNEFYHQIVAPVARRLLAPTAAHRILEIACSSGLFARELAETAESVLGTDVSPRFIELAKGRSAQFNNLRFSELDATEIEQIKALGSKKFNAAVCNMALMDLPEIEPLFAGLTHVLEKNSPLVATLLHPCFNNDDLNFFIESSIQNNQLVKKRGVKITHYLTPKTFEQIGIPGQTRPHYFFHRSLQRLLEPAFKNGWILDRFEELTLPTRSDTPEASLDRAGFPEIPAVLGLRFRSP